MISLKPHFFRFRYASWCRVCAFLEPKYRRVARSLVDTCIFAKADGLLVEYNEGHSGPSNLKSRAGIIKYPTFQARAMEMSPYEHNPSRGSSGHVRL